MRSIDVIGTGLADNVYYTVSVHRWLNIASDEYRAKYEITFGSPTEETPHVFCVNSRIYYFVPFVTGPWGG